MLVGRGGCRVRVVMIDYAMLLYRLYTLIFICTCRVSYCLVLRYYGFYGRINAKRNELYHYCLMSLNINSYNTNIFHFFLNFHLLFSYSNT